jgi:site-specific recombinase XerD
MRAEVDVEDAGRSVSRDGRDTHKRDDAPRGVFRPRSGVWGIRFTCGCGRLHEETIGRVKKDAVDAYYSRRARVKQEPAWCPRSSKRAPAPLFKDYARDFITWAKQHHRSWTKDDSRLSRVLPVLGESRLDIITTADVERFLDALTTGERQIAPATRNRYRDLLSGMFKRAVRLGLVVANPVKGIPKVKEAGGRVLYLPPATKERPAHEEAALTKALPADLRPLFLVSVHTGLRWSEQSALRWKDVDVLSGTLTVARSKNGHQRAVPMNATVRSVFLDASLSRKSTDQPDERVFPMAYRTVARVFDRAVKTAQAALRDTGKNASLLEGYTWHCNRHTFASRLGMAGVDLLSVQKLGGWRTLSMVQRYAHLAPDHLRAAVERLTVAELGVNLDSTPSSDITRIA